ncbi:hypothetical protein H5368_13295 [Luteimonas sp. MC1782]|uniref:hypothetical protein n=1 Tax=Luteimonas sp. MC1782 TaxID=2760305 RepID=UPI001601DC27|nr:hypothetical protein [Luteimonas sp. MC1782]MBB1474005.1 hypothetical protein [Luteimonas sp. MC1782]
MTFSAALAIIVLASSSVSPELCRNVENKIEPDMRILESDLSQSAAIQAAEELEDMIARGDLTGAFQFGALNQSKIIHGHILLRQATTDRDEFGSGSVESRESARLLCTWLNTEGFWYD